MTPTYFKSAAELRRWFEKHHATKDELFVGFLKTSTGQPSVTWPEAVDEALCFGWIDAVRRRIDDERYVIRFTRRKPKSHWSLVNVKKAEALIAAGRMRPEGLLLFEQRETKRTGRYSFEQDRAAIEKGFDDAPLRKHRKAFAHFDAQAPSYKRAVMWWLMSAKKEETRERRVEQWAAHHEKGERLPQFTGNGVRGKKG